MKKIFICTAISLLSLACSHSKKATTQANNAAQNTVANNESADVNTPMLNIPLENLSMENYNKIAASNKIVIVDFNAVWCGPCKRLTPILEQLEQEYGNKIRVVKIDIDHNKQVTSDFAIMSIPFVKMYKNGVLAEQWEGLPSKANLKYWIEKLLK